MSFWSAIIGGLTGGIVTGIFTILAVYIIYKKEKEKIKEQEESLIKSLLQSIHDELETLWDIYQKEIGTYLESLQENKPLLHIYVITHDYFTVYHSNSFLIGKIKNNDLRKRIITTYTIAKGLIDSYKLNNELV